MSAPHLDPSRWRRLAARALPLVLVAGTFMAAPAQASAEPVDGAQTVGDAMFPHVGNGGYDALHYDVDLAWQANGVVSSYMTGELTSASATMRARTTGAPLRSFSLDFEGLTIDSVTVNGAPAAYERVQDAELTKFKLVVTPAEPVEGEFTTKVTYHGVPSRHVDADGSYEGWNATADGATFLGQPIGAMAGYPHNNTPADKATYTFSLDVPSSLTSATGTGPAAAVSNGELESRSVSPDGTRTTWEWVQRQPMASELALVSIGKYDVIESDVTLSDGRVIPEWSFMDSALSTANKTTITNRRALLGDFLRRLEGIYGPYPGNSTGVVVDTVPSGINYALETQDRSFFPSTSSVNGNTLIHELVHQWYGNNVSPGLWTDIWINEGMGTWGPTYHNQVLAAATPNPAAVETTYFNSWNGRPGDAIEWRTPPGAQTDPADLYGYHTYTRGAQFWEALRTALRDDAFLEVLEQWQTRHAGTSPRADRLKELAEEVSGLDLDAFWQDWILDEGKPAWPGKYDVSLTADPGQGSVEAGGEITYTVRAANVGKVPLAGAVVTVDVADVVDDATLGALPDGVTRDGSTLTWTVPDTALAESTSATFTATAQRASDDVFATAEPASLGGACVECGALESAPTPTVTGTAKVGETLTASAGAWPEGTELAYQWIVDGVARSGATESTFVPELGDAGQDVVVTVTGDAPGHTATRRVSDPVRVAGLALTSTPTPRISGAARYGSTLRAHTGTWDEGVTLTYRWRRDGVPIAGATSATYRAALADIGRRLTVQVTGTRAGYESVSKVSAPTARIAKAVLPRGRVKVSGKPVVGRVLTARATGFGPGTKVTYRWYVGGKRVSTAKQLRVRKAYVGKRVAYRVTITRPGHATVTRTGKVGPKVRRR